MPEGSIVTADFRTDRVRIFCDANDKVSGVPRVGWITIDYIDLQNYEIRLNNEEYKLKM